MSRICGVHGTRGDCCLPTMSDKPCPRSSASHTQSSLGLVQAGDSDSGHRELDNQD